MADDLADRAGCAPEGWCVDPFRVDDAALVSADHAVHDDVRMADANPAPFVEVGAGNVARVILNAARVGLAAAHVMNDGPVDAVARHVG